MAEGKFSFNWSALGNVIRTRKSEETLRDEPVVDSPWMLLAASGGQERRGADTRMEDEDRAFQATHAAKPGAKPQRQSRIQNSSGNSRWLSEMNSPYGFLDEDGTQKEIDSKTWRRVQQPRKARRFVPRTAQASSNPSPTAAPASQRPGGSTWVMQLVVAIALAGCGIYAHSQNTTVAADLNRVFENAYTTDYSTQALPTLSNFLASHHIAVPSFIGSKGELTFHLPLDGTIVSDYSKDNARITLQGKANAPVFADANGTIVKVTKLADGYMVTIHHGTVGDSQYFGLGTVSVKQGETVQSGQTIGKLKSTTQAQMQFGIAKNGAYVNPHDYIQFTNSSGSA